MIKRGEYFSAVKYYFLAVLLIGIGRHSFAQEGTDSTNSQIKLFPQPVISGSLQKLDHVADSLLPSLQKLDSLRAGFNRSADSLQRQYKNTIADISSKTTKITRSIDSLQ